MCIRDSHMKADQNDAENLLVLLGAANVNYIMAIPHGDDIMLNYQTTGYHEMCIRDRLLIASQLKKEVLDYCFPSHCSTEPGYRIVSDYLGLSPMRCV